MSRQSLGGTERCPFSLLAYQVLVVEKTAPVRDVAVTLRLSTDALYSRLRGRTRFRPAEIRDLIDCVADQRFLRFFADDSRFIIVPRPSPDVPMQEISAAAAEAVRAAADIMQIMSQAIARARPLGPRDRSQILDEVRDAELALAELRSALAADRNPALERPSMTPRR